MLTNYRQLNIAMIKNIILYISLFIASASFAQPNYVYTSLDKVMHPDSVYILSLKRNKLDTFPSIILSFSNLRELDLSHNKIKTLPKEIGQLSNLEILNLDKNKITYIPEEIGKLSNLRELRLSRNKIYDLPESMSNMSNMKRLILWSNGIKTFPQSFGKLNSSIEFIDLRNNPMMLYDDQETIKEMLPKPEIKMDNVCNCE